MASPAGVMRPSLLLSTSVNHRLPSGPAVIACGLVPSGSSCRTMAPVDGSMRAIAFFAPVSVNHTPPSEPVTMSPGVWSRAVGNSVIAPVGVMRATPASRPCSVNHRLPSGPAVMLAGALPAVSAELNSVTTPACAEAGSAAHAATDASVATRRRLTLRDTG